MRHFSVIVKDYDKSMLDGKQVIIRVSHIPISSSEFRTEVYGQLDGKVYLLTHKENSTIEEKRKEIEAKNIALNNLKELASSLKLPNHEMETMNFIFDEYEKELRYEREIIDGGPTNAA